LLLLFTRPDENERERDAIFALVVSLMPLFFDMESLERSVRRVQTRLGVSVFFVRGGCGHVLGKCGPGLPDIEV
jgi:hypothetical protein